MKKAMYIFVSFALVLLLAAPSLAAPEIMLRFAGQGTVDHTGTVMMEQVAKEVLEKTDGRIEIKVYPANILGDYTLVFEELMRGTIDMACISVPSQFNPNLEVTYINCFVSGYEEAKKVFAEGGWLFNKMNELCLELGVRVLGFQVTGFIGTASSKPVVEPLNPKVSKEVLVRVPNMDVYKLGAETMGYRTVTIPWSDVYTSMQTGVCDGVNGMDTVAAWDNLRDVMKYWYQTNYSVENWNYLISEMTWKKLSPEDQKIIQEACSKVTQMGVDLAEKDQDRHLQMMKDRGIQIFTYTPEELKPLFEAVSATWDKLKGKFDPEMIEEFKKEYATK
jgi:TRAP-type C4-dicarboxylate transport system substrate-binding protein